MWLLHFSYWGIAEENRVTVAEGFKRIELISEVVAITPGKPFRLGMRFTLLPDYHTYWRGPGVVGVAPTFEWNLPEGFLVGETFWPAPEVVDMVGIKANGYHDEVLLITEITPPADIKESKVSIKLRAAWMACATSCHPGLGDFSITIPVQTPGSPMLINKDIAATFEQTLKAIPPTAPDDWKWSIRKKDSTIFLKLDLPDSRAPLALEEIHFFCNDLQVDSDQAQTTRKPNSSRYDLVQRLPSPEFSPKNPAKLSGLLFNKNGWPGIDSNYVDISIPWPTDPSDHE